MLLFTLGLTLLGLWPIAGHRYFKSIVPSEVRIGQTFSIFCDDDRARVPDNPLGIYYISLDGYFSNPNGEYSYLSSPSGPMKNLKPHWHGYETGSEELNTFKLFKRGAKHVEIKIYHAQSTDAGRYCCYVKYKMPAKDDTAIDCEWLKVTDKAIVTNSIAREGEAESISCDGDLAGIYTVIKELDYIFLAWVDEPPEAYRNVTFAMGVDPNTTLPLHVLKEKKPHFDFLKSEWNIKPNRRVDKDGVTLAIKINKITYEDTGYFCCGAQYFDQENKHYFNFRCQSILVTPCGELPEIVNGVWKRPCDDAVGCDMQCNPGYALRGEAEVRCVADVEKPYFEFNGSCAGAEIIGPHRVVAGDQIDVTCDADLAGVPKNALGMNKLEVVWGNNASLIEVFGYTKENGKYEMLDPSKSRKYFEPFGITNVNSNGWLKMDEFRLEIKVQNSNAQDGGRVCCESLYFDVFKKLEASSQCIEVLVGNNAILHPGSTTRGRSVNVSCSAELAGINGPTMGLMNLMLTWKRGNSAAYFEIKPNPSNLDNADTNINAPGRTQQWKFVKNAVLKNRNNGRFEEGSTTIGLEISDVQTDDSGLFCCESSFSFRAGQPRHSAWCHKLSVTDESVISYSINASTSVHVSDGLVFVVLVWMMMQLYLTSCRGSLTV